MFARKPELEGRWVNLYKQVARFLFPLERVAEDAGREDLVPIIFHGEHDLAPGAVASQGVPVRWIDSERCVEIGRWLDSITPAEIGKAAFESYRKRWRDRDAIWTSVNDAEQRIQYELVRELQELFSRTGRDGHVVIVLIN